MSKTPKLIVSAEHDLNLADPKCSSCRGAGYVLANYSIGGKAIRFACHCVPVPKGMEGKRSVLSRTRRRK